MDPNEREDVRKKEDRGQTDAHPVGSDYEVDPFLARRALEDADDDLFDGDW